MRVSEAMTRDVRIATPGQSIRDVAKTMAEIDAGALPVGENDRLIGMIPIATSPSGRWRRARARIPRCAK
jgi:CBS domain-containing protein